MQTVDTNTTRIRNIGIMAHIDAGKTTTTERVLFDAGVSSRVGQVDDGTTITDWMAEEQSRGISITSAATTFHWREHQINLIDTPGHVDFTIEVERSLRVLDGAIAVVCGVAGVESQTETVWRQADKYRVPRLVFVNKLDRDGADPDAVLASIDERLGAATLKLHLACGVGQDFAGVVDLVRMVVRTWDDNGLVILKDIPSDLSEDATDARQELLESLADHDDTFAEAFLNDDFGNDDITSAVRRCCLDRKAVPVIMGAALKNRGIHALLDAVVDFLPSPLDGPEIVGFDPQTGGHRALHPTTKEPLAALAFKVMADSPIGQLTFLRVYSGELVAGQKVWVPRIGAEVAVPKLVRMHANHGEQIRALPAGDIGAAVDTAYLTTGDTLCAHDAPIVLDDISAPEPVIGIAVEPKSDKDLDALQRALAKLAAEDPTLVFRVDPESLQTIVSGMGELHLEVVLERLRNEYKIEARAGRPRVAYRETISKEVQLDIQDVGVWSGSIGRFAAFRMTAKPAARGEGVSLQIVGTIDADIDRAIRDNVHNVLSAGSLAGFPVTDIHVVVDKIVVHPVDSSPASFAKAALDTTKRLLREGAAILLEPVMAVELLCPDDYVGDVMGDFTARRGNIAGISTRSGVQVIAGFVPLANMFGYATDLRSKTRGRASFSMQFHQYQEVPTNLTNQIVTNTGV